MIKIGSYLLYHHFSIMPPLFHYTTTFLQNIGAKYGSYSPQFFRPQITNWYPY